MRFIILLNVDFDWKVTNDDRAMTERLSIVQVHCCPIGQLFRADKGSICNTELVLLLGCTNLNSLFKLLNFLKIDTRANFVMRVHQLVSQSFSLETCGF